MLTSKYVPPHLRHVTSKFHDSTVTNKLLEAELFPPVVSKSSVIDDAPVSVSGDGSDLPPLTTFATSVPQLNENITRAGYVSPTPVQKWTIPYSTAGRDIMACAQTGSGKTAAFLFPIIEHLMADVTITSASPTGRRCTAFPHALILAPTRELAMQIYTEARRFCYKTGIRPVVVFGGVEHLPQIADLERGADILIATPGRLLDFAKHDKISLRFVKHFVLDEADRMLDMGFEEQIRNIISIVPTVRQTYMFSATFPIEIQALAKHFMKAYIFITVGSIGSPCKDVKQCFEIADEAAKYARLCDILLEASVSDKFIIFVATKKTADTLHMQLTTARFPTTSIHGDRTQAERIEALAAFRCGEIPILVATDVAARGLDVSDITYVINYDMSTNMEDYVHRIGRTGRCGRAGTSITFLNRESAGVISGLIALLKSNDVVVPDTLRLLLR